MALKRLPVHHKLKPTRVRMRRNPDAFDDEPPPVPAGWTEAKMKESLRDFNKELSEGMRRLEREAIRLGVRQEDLPNQANRLIGQEVKAARYLFAAASHPELADYALYSVDEDELAERLFTHTLGLLRMYEEREIKELADKWRNFIAERICALRSPVRAHFAQFTGEDPERDCRVRPKVARAVRVPPAPTAVEELEDMSDEELEALIRAEEGGEEVEEVVRPVPVRPAPRPAPASAPKADKKKPTDTGYKDYIVKTRVRVPGEPSDALMSAARGDVLVFRLRSGDTQVWVKGALTLTFTHSRGRSSTKIAALYANEWRKEGGKKREKCRILAGQEGSSDFTVVAESLAQIAAAKPRREVPMEREIDDLKRMDLRNNPDLSKMSDEEVKRLAQRHTDEMIRLIDEHKAARTGDEYRRTYAAWREAERLAIQAADEFMLRQSTKRNPDWGRLFSRAKQKGGEAKAAAALAARRTAHEAKILAVKAKLAAERARYRSAYNAMDFTYAEIEAAAERKDKQALQAEYDLIDHVTGLDEGWKPDRTVALSRLKKGKLGYFGLESQLAELQQTRPNPRRVMAVARTPRGAYTIVSVHGDKVVVERGNERYVVTARTERELKHQLEMLDVERLEWMHGAVKRNRAKR